MVPSSAAHFGCAQQTTWFTLPVQTSSNIRTMRRLTRSPERGMRVTSESGRQTRAQGLGRRLQRGAAVSELWRARTLGGAQPQLGFAQILAAALPRHLESARPHALVTSNTVKVPKTASITRWSALCGVPGWLAVSDSAAHLEVMTRALTSPPASQASRRARIRGQHWRRPRAGSGMVGTADPHLR